MTRDSLAAALAARDGRCPDGCETTRALFPSAIEAELAGGPADATLYARLDACPACDAEYMAALDLAFALDAAMPRAAETPALRLPTPLRFYRADADAEDTRRVAEDGNEYKSEGDETR